MTACFRLRRLQLFINLWKFFFIWIKYEADIATDKLMSKLFIFNRARRDGGVRGVGAWAAPIPETPLHVGASSAHFWAPPPPIQFKIPSAFPRPQNKLS